MLCAYATNCNQEHSVIAAEGKELQGKLVNETRCLRCETVTSREEAFYDLSLEIEQNSSLTACLRNFRYFKKVTMSLHNLSFTGLCHGSCYFNPSQPASETCCSHLQSML